MKRLAAALVGVASLALAFVLPGPAILKHMVKGRDEAHLFTLRVDGSISFIGSAAREAQGALGLFGDRSEVQADASISLKLPGRCRIELSTIEGGKTAVAETNGKRRVEGREIQELSILSDEICALLAFRSSSDAEGEMTLERHLRSLQIDPGAETSLARASQQIGELQVAYVIGSRAEGKPQFWVYRDNFLPARISFADPAGQRWDIRFSDYSSPATGDWFPRLIEMFKNDERVLRFTSLKADPRAQLADRLF